MHVLRTKEKKNEFNMQSEDKKFDILKKPFGKCILSLVVCLLISMSMSARTNTLRIAAHDGHPLYTTVYTPPDYSPDSIYPVLYLLHGIHGNQYAWEKKAHISALADSLIRDSLICPVLIVMPLCIVHDTTYAVKVPCYLRCMHDFLHHIRHGEFEPYFPEIEQFIDSHYLPSDTLDAVFAAAFDSTLQCLSLSQQEIFRYLSETIQEAQRLSAQSAPNTMRDLRPKSRDCLVGISSGGRQAVQISASTGEQFAVVGLFSPVLIESQFPKESRGCIYWIRCGKGDIFRRRARIANDYLERQQMPHDYSRTNGRHNWSVWRRYIADFLIYAYGIPDGKAFSIPE